MTRGAAAETAAAEAAALWAKGREGEAVADAERGANRACNRGFSVILQFGTRNEIHKEKRHSILHWICDHCSMTRLVFGMLHRK